MDCKNDDTSSNTINFVYTTNVLIPSDCDAITDVIYIFFIDGLVSR